jgi:hypothetical protein
MNTRNYTLQLRTFCLFGALFCFTQVQAQGGFDPDGDQSERNKGNGILLHLGLGAHLPGADLDTRFGTSGTLGGGVERISERNFFIGLEGHYLFGPTVDEDPLANLRTAEGYIIGNDRSLASVVLRQRGWYAGATLGKLFTLGKSRSGLRISLGGGWLQHKIRIQDDTQSVTQLTGDYKKGYDRLTAGPALQQFIGWQQLGAKRRNNFMIGLEFNQGFTNTRREWDFELGRKLDQQRLDLRFGIRASWTIPFYTGNAETIYY